MGVGAETFRKWVRQDEADRGERSDRPSACSSWTAAARGATLITFGRRDMVTSTRFADPLKNGITNSEVVVFDGCAHAPIYEKVNEFNERTLAFLKHQSG